MVTAAGMLFFTFYYSAHKQTCAFVHSRYIWQAKITEKNKPANKT